MSLPQVLDRRLSVALRHRVAFLLDEKFFAECIRSVEHSTFGDWEEKIETLLLTLCGDVGDEVAHSLGASDMRMSAWNTLRRLVTEYEARYHSSECLRVAVESLHAASSRPPLCSWSIDGVEGCCSADD